MTRRRSRLGEEDRASFDGARPIPAFPGYFVTPSGEVWSTRVRVVLGQPRGGVASRDGLPHRLKTCRDRDGYLIVTLFGHCRRSVHCLVLETFVGPRPKGQVARHLDGNCGNPTLENLCWGTYAENEADKLRHGTKSRGDSHKWARINEETVEAIRSAARTETHKRVAERFGVHKSYVSHLLRGDIRRVG